MEKCCVDSKNDLDDKGISVADELAELCKALGHPARVKILAHLEQVDECVCGHIVDVLPLAQSTVSQHLKILKRSGLVRGEVDGPKTCYCVNRDKLKRFYELTAQLCCR